MTLAPGARIGPYEITAKLGEGGMGEVWRATDTRLRREVALKVLPAAFVADAERLARFEREAQLLAQLHHPHVASVFGLEESDGTRALAMELAPGEDLAERIARGPIPVDEAIAIALQIAEALEAAHEKGIVHRDLKPQNVKVAPDGTVKVLDFGLAKALEPAGATVSAADLARSPTLLNSPTLTAVHGTQLGVILGTAAYMAPEQARGGAVDKRADVWAFGVICWEMLTGRPLFAADTVSDTLAGVLKSDVDHAALPAATPAAVRRLVRRCLERNPKNRLHDVADARIVLAELIAGVAVDAEAPAPPPGRRRALLALAGGLAAGLLLGLAAWPWLPRRVAEAPARLIRFEIASPGDHAFVTGLAVAPDGRAIAFVARDASGTSALWLRRFEDPTPHRVGGTQGARLPFWAPDSRRVGFFAERAVRWVDSRGGEPVDVAATPGTEDVRGGAWGADDVILYAPSYVGPLLAVPARGGESAPATRLPADGAIGTTRFPAFLPDGRRFLFYGSAGAGTEPGTLFLGRVGSLDAKALGPSNSTAAWAPPGYLLYSRGNALVAQRFDDEREELVGDPVPLGLDTGGSISIAGLRSMGISWDGTLALRADTRSATQLGWFGRDGTPLEVLGDEAATWHYAPRLSPDGRSALVSHYASGGKLGEIWWHDLARNVASRVTFDGADDYVPLWIPPAGREVLFNSARAGAAAGIYRIHLDRPSVERQWLGGGAAAIPSAATPDGKRVVFERPDAQGRTAIWIRDLDGDAEPTRLSATSASESQAALSPDGRWLAYVSDATRTAEVYARRLDGTGGTVRISGDGGTQPLWSRNGRELFYLDARGRLVAVPVTLGEELATGAAQPLFAARLEEATDRQYDAAPDGSRFLLNRSLTVDNVPIQVVLDWMALLPRETR